MDKFWSGLIKPYIDSAEEDVWFANKKVNGVYRCYNFPNGYTKYKEIGKAPVIYIIYIPKTDKLYIGSSFEVFDRWYTHIKECKRQVNKCFYSDLAQNDAYLLIYDILPTGTTDSQLRQKESKYISAFWKEIERCCLNKNHYNEDISEVHQKYMYNITLPSIK